MTDGPKDPMRSGVYRVSRREQALRAAAGAGAVRVDLTGVRDKAALLEALARALDFPDWFGGNWDALEDCLADLSWRRPGEVVLVFEGGSDLEDDDRGILLDVLAASAEYWAERGRRFVAVFVGGPAALPELEGEPKA